MPRGGQPKRKQRQRDEERRVQERGDRDDGGVGQLGDGCSARVGTAQTVHEGRDRLVDLVAHLVVAGLVDDDGRPVAQYLWVCAPPPEGGYRHEDGDHQHHDEQLDEREAVLVLVVPTGSHELSIGRSRPPTS